MSAPGSAPADLPARRPRWPAELAGVRDRLDARFRANPYLAAAGIEVLGWGPGWATLRLVPGPSAANLVGTVHGGVVTGLADAAFEIACNGYGRVCVALDLAGHFAAPAAVGTPLVADAEEVSRGRRTASYRITVRRAEDRSRRTRWGPDRGGPGREDRGRRRRRLAPGDVVPHRPMAPRRGRVPGGLAGPVLKPLAEALRVHRIVLRSEPYGEVWL